MSSFHFEAAETLCFAMFDLFNFVLNAITIAHLFASKCAHEIKTNF